MSSNPASVPAITRADETAFKGTTLLGAFSRAQKTEEIISLAMASLRNCVIHST